MPYFMHERRRQTDAAIEKSGKMALSESADNNSKCS